MFAFFLSPLGRKVGLAIGAVVLLAAVSATIYQRGKSAGYGAGQRAQLDDDRKSLDQERQQFQDTLRKAGDQISDANSRIESADAARTNLEHALAQVQVQRQQAAAKVASLPDKDLFVDVVQKLGTRDAGDATPNFIAPELRKIDQIVTDYGGIQQQLDKLGADQAAANQKIEALNDKVKGLETQRDAALAWGNQLMGHYVKAYNAAQKKPSTFVRVITLGLVHGKHLDIPDPVTLEAAAPKVGK